MLLSPHIPGKNNTDCCGTVGSDVSDGNGLQRNVTACPPPSPENVPEFSAARKMKAVERELGYRRRVFKRRVENGDLHPSIADEEIRVFEAIRDDYARLAKAEPAGPLFGGA